MDIAAVIQELTQDRGLDREKIIQVICQGILGAYKKKFPNLTLDVVFDAKTNKVEVFALKTVVKKPSDNASEISLKQAEILQKHVEVGDQINVPLNENVGRIDIMAAKQVIADGIRCLEEETIYKEYIEKQGSLITGTIHKRERTGYAVNFGEAIGFIPVSCMIPDETLKIGFTLRALLKEVLPTARGGYQLILDRASSDFVRKLLEAEIPEIFEKIVEIKAIERVPGYKTKIAVVCQGKEVDPVGTCVGVGGSRIKPILKELGGIEKIDLITWSENPEALIRESLKPAQIDKVLIDFEAKSALVWLAEDQRSMAIGRMGQNIALASQLTGFKINLHKS